MTATWPTNIPPKMKSPHSAVPQNFHILGGTGGGTVAAGGYSGVRVSIDCLSGQRPLQQTGDIAAGKIDRAVHAGVIPAKPRRSEQFGLARRYCVERGSGREQRQ